MRYNTALRIGKEMLSNSWACSSTVEQGTHNPLVLGSNPGGPTKNRHAPVGYFRRAHLLYDAIFQTRRAFVRLAWEALPRIRRWRLRLRTPLARQIRRRRPRRECRCAGPPRDRGIGPLP